MTRQTISDNQHTFEIVERVPMGYQIWNIGKNMIDGYLPLCRVIPGTFSIEPETLKVITLEKFVICLAIRFLHKEIKEQPRRRKSMRL